MMWAAVAGAVWLWQWEDVLYPTGSQPAAPCAGRRGTTGSRGSMHCFPVVTGGAAVPAPELGWQTHRPTSVHLMTFPLALYSEPWNIFTLVIDSMDLPSIGLTTLQKGGRRVSSDSAKTWAGQSPLQREWPWSQRAVPERGHLHKQVQEGPSWRFHTGWIFSHFVNSAQVINIWNTTYTAQNLIVEPKIDLESLKLQKYPF